MQNPDKAKIYFPHLDGMRFICFLMVFFFHCYKVVFVYLRNGSQAEQQFYNATAFLFQNGELGVNFFFVLSGFLITFLLIKEKEFTGTIHLRNFYIRRVLRIWPLFYLCVFIGFVIIPGMKYFAGLPNNEIARPLYYLLFINNFDYISSWPQFPDALILIVLWSVAVEEQFYLSWPVLLKIIPQRSWPVLFMLVVAGTFIFRSFYTGHTEKEYAVRNFHTLSVIGDMAVGAMFAYLTSANTLVKRFIERLPRAAIFMLYACTLALYLFRDPVLEAHAATLVAERFIIALLFALIIAEQCFAQNSLFKFGRFKWLSRAGLYTYALYCLHFFVISMVLAAFKKFAPMPLTVFSTIAISLAALLFTYFLSKLSYRFFEKPFLKLKDRFAFITR